ncbi:RagB/SusD family nutrient uptake outer membrane protein [Chryseolinea lacunae]|uniref:RagB/SusD family nutrient uptake outer membrane protein n=1 Tax=Chryseolinea lacunae TaxID=2801331 RepID=A0ABS1KL41_9BACT|nr:RagB/SusD family nutrient uptake outer membrane protein [Chryseolinea lacunae]MBL0740175.1 RagB/SusD family nutrient uptake outer membrane protein [Chryseolinea lacunae]
MKKIIILLLFAAFAGCKDFLEENPKGAIVGTNAISDVAGLEAALTGTYKGILRTWARGFLNSSTQSFTMGGDDLTTIRAGNEPKMWSRQIDQFEVTSGNSHIAFIWNGCYKTIQGANNIINNYQNVSGDQSVVKQIVGEAYFLRGLCYYWLVRGFGSVPLITSADFTQAMLTIKKTGAKEIYELIEADLKQAEELVGNVKRDPGRPNKGSVKALLADVYLTEGGWPLKDASKYALAAAKAKEVIDNKATYGFDLVPLETLWSGTTTAIGTKEEVMAFHSSKNFGGSTNAYYGHPGTPKEENGWEDFCAEIHFFNKFPEGKRKDITFHTEFVKSDGTIVPWQNSAEQKPYFGKFRLAVNNTWQSSLPVHMIRYAHVLLVYAEAQARTAAPSEDAYDALNAIRERAELDPLDGLSQADFINAVVDERAWEFAGEFTRWFDLQRLELVEQANANKDMNDLKPLNTITKSDYTFPIPLNDITINPNLNLDGD